MGVRDAVQVQWAVNGGHMCAVFIMTEVTQQYHECIILGKNEACFQE